MTALQFRLILFLFALLLATHMMYNPGRVAPSERFAWVYRLPPYQFRLFVIGSLISLVAGLVGFIGMFFFLRWAAIIFFVAAAEAELFRPYKPNLIEKALDRSIVASEVLLLYLVFFCPAKTLFA